MAYKWPPNKAWTSKLEIIGQNHFVLINYGINNKIYWVNLVSVVDSSICFVLDFDVLSNKLLWIPGWHDLEKKLIKDEDFLGNINDMDNRYVKGFLNPSNDSGLSIGSDAEQIRPWFI